MVWTTFLKRLRELREAAGLSLADVAERARMDKGFVSRLETGQGNPTVATLARYAAVLGVRVWCSGWRRRGGGGSERVPALPAPRGGPTP